MPAPTCRRGKQWRGGPIAALTAVLLAAAGAGGLPVPSASAKSPAPAAKAAAAPAAVAAPAAPARPQLATLPKPAASSPEEIAHIKLLDEAIAPIRDAALSVEDATAIRDAVKALAANKVTESQSLKAQIKDPVGRKLVDWYRLRSGYGDVAEYRAFLDQNPAWPDRTLLTQRLEEALFTSGGSAASIKAAFKDNPPRTGIGMAALASALLAEGDKDAAAKLAAQAWREETIPATLETGFLDRFKSLLTLADHKWRFDRLLIDDLRYKAERGDRAALARRVIALLPEAEQKRANARLAVFLKAPGAQALIDAAANDASGDWGFQFHRIQQLRMSKRTDEAAKLLLAAPTDPKKMVSPDGWWFERRANAYIALNAGKSKLAYDLIKDAGPLSVNPAKEQAFMAGWMAFRLLKEPKAAETHLTAMRKAADGPLSRAKASYWLARVAEARGDGAKAKEHYQEAAADGDTFHGLLARLKLEPTNRAIAIKPPQAPSREEIDAFNKLDAARAAVIARRSSLDAPVIRAFLYGLRNYKETETQVALVGHLADALGETQTGVRIAKNAIAKRQNLLYYGYPLHPFPAYTPLRVPPETAFLLGIARQETEFNKLTVSGAGAKGLLQVMTVTAEHVCRDYKVKCEIPRLLSDTSYNTMIASAYIADRMGEFGGSYVLTLVGYNAGPGRARQWIKQFGDPRDPKIDPVDWIERIPFQETREYVSKVLANVQIYRARLGESNPLRLDQDLARARGSKVLPGAPAGAPDAATPDDG